MTETSYDIVGIGAALVDILAPVDDAFLTAHDLTRGHMHLIDTAQAAQLQDALAASGADLTVVSGGSAANTCLGFAAFGGKAAFAGRVADDPLGAAFRNDMERFGLVYGNLLGDTPGQEQVPTGRCYSLITSDGERTMCTYLGASNGYNAADITLPVITAARLLYIEGYAWTTPECAAACDVAIRAAKAAGREVAFTLSDAWVAEGFRDVFMGYLKDGLVDVLFANEAEIMALTQCADFESAQQAASGLAKCVAITRSEKGAVILQNGESVSVAAQKVEKLVDATGAGDLFAAGFLYGYLAGAGLAQAGQLGTLAAAEVISHIGARPKADLRQFLSQAGMAA